uniref:G-protein coupled receptors family 1 profile domain-containing protein n=1 Tax=Ciona savignyi TaxID=51511 RepID=H2YSI9_CIOSA
MWTNKTSTARCSPSKHWEFLVLLPIGFISIVLNLTLVLAASINRKRLQRQSYVYVCVINTLLSNLCYVIMHTWIILDNYVTKMEPEDAKYTVTWTVLQVCVASMLFVMCGNIGALLFVVLDSTYFVGRSVNRKASEFAKGFLSDIEAVRGRQWLLGVKRRRAVFLIAISWLVPLCLAIVASVTWNCASQCVYCRGSSSLAPPCVNHTYCSTVFPPLRSSYLGLNFGLWILELMVLVYSIRVGIKSFHQVMAPPVRASSMPVSSDHESETPKEEYSLSDLNNAITSIESESANQLKLDEPKKESSAVLAPNKLKSLKRAVWQESTRKPCDGSQINRTRPSFRTHSRLTFMILITVTFVVCSSPTFIVFLIDICIEMSSQKIARLLSTLTMYIYTFICPFLLLKYLPNLKSALVLMFNPCSVTRRRKNKRKTKADVATT